jgi:uncharacterized protein YndB with AHSA1/START domain
VGEEKMTEQDMGQKELVLRRIFGAPREKVWRAWTECELLAQWWGPRRFTNPVCEVDARPGGAVRIEMQGPDGARYPMKGVFHEVSTPKRLVFTSSAYDDEAGNPQLEVLNTATFAEREGTTEMHLHAVVVKAIGPWVKEALAGMEQGWSESLYKLADLLDKI